MRPGLQAHGSPLALKGLSVSLRSTVPNQRDIDERVYITYTRESF
ncbi:hypothetical protein PG5_61570 [Pseudomonas sp. G5(2012)]|nr:hypothetical protein PG5_61570 [Pseudomonas sp. G5(2012)]